MQLPFSSDRLHFLGIGGIGMSGIAEMLHRQGFRVSGSDCYESANVQRLRELAIPITIGQKAGECDGAGAVIVSSAISSDNPALIAAKQQKIPIVSRAEMLAELMRLKWSICVAGTHGKTTTTSLIAHVLEYAGLDPTVINGGIINAYKTNARFGQGDWFVAEADESDGSFTRFAVTVAVVTNIDREHMDHYGDFDTVRAAYRQFVSNIPFYGFAVLCLDHPEIQSLMAKSRDRRVVSYGSNPHADIQVLKREDRSDGAFFKVALTVPGARKKGKISAQHHDFFLPMHGNHNVLNALAAIAVANEMAIDPKIIAKALACFSGVRRRFTITGTVNNVTIIDDYAHHPVEIDAVLRAARSLTKGQLIAIVQPHRYSRLRDLFVEFSKSFYNADLVLIADVYAAGEAPSEGMEAPDLAQSLIDHGHPDARYLSDPDQLPALLAARLVPSDTVVFLGAGNSTDWAHHLPDALRQHWGNEDHLQDHGLDGT
ncbi:MAG: UDP-N-acetylmuramate--L-alanine ligase [Pseudomonadota bacterium]